jgi:DNA polymerase/3'-5' exonuclease PolX
MENVEIANLLNKYAELLEIQGGDLFRIRAYRNAARTIESLSQPTVQRPTAPSILPLFSLSQNFSYERFCFERVFSFSARMSPS